MRAVGCGLDDTFEKRLGRVGLEVVAAGQSGVPFCREHLGAVPRQSRGRTGFDLALAHDGPVGVTRLGAPDQPDPGGVRRARHVGAQRGEFFERAKHACESTPGALRLTAGFGRPSMRPDEG